MIWQGLGLAMVAAFAAVTSSWAVDRDPPTRILSVRTPSAPVAPGGTLLITYEIDRVRSCAIKIDRVLYDSQRTRVVLEDLDFAASPDPIGPTNYSVKIMIPRTFVDGPAMYQTVSRYECNLLHRLWPIVVLQPPVRFEVAGAPVSSQPVTVVP